METAPPAGPRQHESDEQILHKLGYAQELFRGMGGFQNFAISFTIISILAGCLTSYFVAFERGGPVAVTWGWLLGLIILFGGSLASHVKVMVIEGRSASEAEWRHVAQKVAA